MKLIAILILSINLYSQDLILLHSDAPDTSLLYATQVFPDALRLFGSAWSTVPTGWTISGGVATYDGTVAGANMRGTPVTYSAVLCKLEFDIISVGDTYANIQFSNGTTVYKSYTNYAVGHHTVYVTPATNDNEIRLYGGISAGATSFVIDNLSLKKK